MHLRFECVYAFHGLVPPGAQPHSLLAVHAWVGEDGVELGKLLLKLGNLALRLVDGADEVCL
jgi:hypothetical protein